MNTNHTEDEIRERAALYALGSLNQFEARAFEQHLDEGCDLCASELASFDTVVEHLAWADAVSSPPHEVRAKLLARVALDGPPQAPARQRPAEDEQARAPRREEEAEFDPDATLRMTRPLPPRPDGAAGAESSAASPPGMLTVRADEGEWVETGDEGVTLKLLFADAEHKTFTTLLRMSPGSRLPRHRHTGTEQCLVLEGDLRAGELRASAGDYICALPGSVHEELSTERGALLLLISPERYEVIA